MTTVFSFNQTTIFICWVTIWKAHQLLIFSSLFPLRPITILTLTMELFFRNSANIRREDISLPLTFPEANSWLPSPRPHPLLWKHRKKRQQQTNWTCQSKARFSPNINAVSLCWPVFLWESHECGTSHIENMHPYWYPQPHMHTHAVRIYTRCRQGQRCWAGIMLLETQLSTERPKTERGDAVWNFLQGSEGADGPGMREIHAYSVTWERYYTKAPIS